MIAKLTTILCIVKDLAPLIPLYYYVLQVASEVVNSAVQFTIFVWWINNIYRSESIEQKNGKSHLCAVEELSESSTYV